MNAEFEMKMTPKTMYNFLMYHTYHGFNGIFSILAGAALLALYAFGGRENSNSWLYLLFGVLFLVYQPWTLLTQAAKQVSTNPVFKKPLRYEVSEEYLKVLQEETENEISWTAVTKVRENGRSIFVYTGKRNAFIWEKAQLGDQTAAVRSLIRAHAKNARLKAN